MAYWVFKALMSPVFFLLWRVRVEGRSNVPSGEPAVLAANHQSFCDSFFLPLVIRRRVTFLAKAEYFDTWRTAWFVRSAGQIPIRRGGGHASERALATAVEVLEQGRLLALYPEGTRSRDRCVHRGKTGVARLARATKVQVIPVGIVGTDRVQPIGRRVMSPFHPVILRFGEPLVFEGHRESSDPAGDALVARDQSNDDGQVEDPGTDGPATSAPGGTDDDEQALRLFTDRLMGEISRLSGRPYDDCYTATSSGPARGQTAAVPPSETRSEPESVVMAEEMMTSQSRPVTETQPTGGHGRVA